MEQNICVVMVAPGRFVVEQRPAPSVGTGDVLIRVEYVGICGSDVHLFRTGKQGENVATQPMILGHEAAGTVVEIGSGVDDLTVGNRVAIEPGAVCGRCAYCRSGKYNLCPHMVFPSTPPFDGAYRTYISVPRYGVYLLPEGVSTREGAMMEPLAVALQNTKRGSVGLGSRVVVLGAGPIGLMNVLACRARGAATILVSGRHTRKLELAGYCGATSVIDVRTADLEHAVLDATGGEGADVVIDCTGTVEGLSSTPALVRNGGKIVMVGMPAQDVVPINVTKLIWKEADLLGSFRYDNVFPTAIDAVAAGTIDVDPLITHEFALTELSAAFDFVIHHRDEVIKAVVRV